MKVYSLLSKIETVAIKALGLLFLVPPLIGVYLFLKTYAGKPVAIAKFEDSFFWSGKIQWQQADFLEGQKGSGGGGYASPLPIYLGLMAIAGTLLITRKTGN